MKNRQIVENIIIGAPKCGTTWIYENLKEVTGVCISNRKETNIFLRDVVIDLQSFWSGLGQVTDVSPDYFISENAIERIKMHNPDVKLIAVLRDPIDRAVSHYQMLRSYGSRALRDWSKDSRVTTETSWVQASLYSKWIPLWRKEFQNNLLVLDFRSMILDPTQFIRIVLEHFGVRNYTNINLSNSMVFSGKGPSRFPLVQRRFAKRYRRLIHGGRFLSAITRIAANQFVRNAYHILFLKRVDESDLENVRGKIETLLESELDFYHNFFSENSQIRRTGNNLS